MRSHDGDNLLANLSNRLLASPCARVHLAGEEELWSAIGWLLADTVLMP